MGTKLKSDSANQSFEDSLKELESILKELESSKVSLDELLEKYGRAKVCLESCRSKLDAAELKIKKLSKDSKEEDFELES